MFNWNYANNRFTSAFPKGTAVITEVKVGDSILYKPALENLSGDQLLDAKMQDADFDLIQDVIEANLILLDQDGVSEDVFNALLAGTLDMVTELLDPDQIFHRVRVQNAKAWMLHQRQIDIDESLLTNWERAGLEWQKSGSEFFCQTKHGKLVIVPEELYQVQLHDSWGSVYKDYIPNEDFFAADQRAREVLTECESPYMSENFLPYIDYTLTSYKQLFPQDIDVMHVIRWNYIHLTLMTGLP